MLFNAKKIVLFVSGSTLCVAEVVPGKQAKVTRHPEIQWDNSSLGDTLSNLKKKYGTDIRLVVDDSNSYVVGFKNLDISDKEKVGEEVSTIVPEDLRATEWGYYTQGDYVQVFAYHREIVENFFNPLRKAGFNIQHIEANSSLIANAVNVKNALIIFKRQHIDIIAADGKAVIATHRVDGDDLLKNITEFLGYLSEKYQWTPAVVFCDGIVPEECRISQFPNLEYKSQSIDTAVAITSILPMSMGEDGDVRKSYRKVITISAVAILSVVLGGGWLAMNRLQLSSGETRRPSPTPVVITSTPIPTATPVATIEAVLKQDYVIEVLNGTAKAGAAGKLTKQLTDGGYEVAKTGNADSDGYDKTRMQYGLTVPKSVRDDLDKFLQDIYTEVIAEPKVASDGADITIIIGE